MPKISCMIGVVRLMCVVCVVHVLCIGVCGGGGGCQIREEGLHGSRGGRPAEGACAKKDV